jgi:glycosyltransferase involved in cell wall biosynthesis
VDDRQIEVAPNVVDSATIRFTPAGRAEIRQRLGISADSFVVGCISRFHPKKRNDVVIDAIKSLDEPLPHLILAGAGEAEEALRARARPLGDHVHFVRPPGHIANLLSAFDVCVFCPSPTEGAPLAVLMAMLAERPCLATGPEGVADLIQPEFGAIVQPNHDPIGLATLLRRYWTDKDLRERQGKAARTYAEHAYDRRAAAERIERLLEGANDARTAKVMPQTS